MMPDLVLFGACARGVRVFMRSHLSARRGGGWCFRAPSPIDMGSAIWATEQKGLCFCAPGRGWRAFLRSSAGPGMFLSYLRERSVVYER